MSRRYIWAGEIIDTGDGGVNLDHDEIVGRLNELDRENTKLNAELTRFRDVLEMDDGENPETLRQELMELTEVTIRIREENADLNHQLAEAYERCAKIRDAVGQWIEAYREQGRTPTLADALHSALLGRFLEGKRFFPEPPPRSFSYPWYNLIETGRDDQCEMYLPNDRPTEIVINQAVWEVLEKLSDNIFRVRWPGTTPEYTAVIHAESFKSTITLIPPQEATDEP